MEKSSIMNIGIIAKVLYRSGIKIVAFLFSMNIMMAYDLEIAQLRLSTIINEERIALQWRTVVHGCECMLAICMHESLMVPIVRQEVEALCKKLLQSSEHKSCWQNVVQDQVTVFKDWLLMYKRTHRSKACAGVKELLFVCRSMCEGMQFFSHAQEEHLSPAESGRGSDVASDVSWRGRYPYVLIGMSGLILASMLFYGYGEKWFGSKINDNNQDSATIIDEEMLHIIADRTNTTINDLRKIVDLMKKN